MFVNILEKLQVFSEWSDWPEKLDLENSIIKTRLAAIDTIQSSLRNHGILPLVKVGADAGSFLLFPAWFQPIRTEAELR